MGSRLVTPIERVGRGVRVGPLLVTPERCAEPAPWVDGCVTSVVRHDGALTTSQRYGGFLVRLGRHTRGARTPAVALTWRGAGMPFPLRWMPRYVWRRAQWRLRGRPTPPPMAAAEQDARPAQ